MNFGAALQQEYPQAEEKFSVVDIVSPSDRPPMTLAAVRGQFSECLIRVQGMLRDAESLDVTDDDRLKFAVALGGEASKIAKRIDAKRKEVTAEATDFVKAVNGFCKATRTGPARSMITKKIGAYQYSRNWAPEGRGSRKAIGLQDKLRREAEEANRRQEEAARKAEGKPRMAYRRDRGGKKGRGRGGKHEIRPDSDGPRSSRFRRKSPDGDCAAAHVRKA